MYKVGITGGIGSGKTLVCGILELLGIPVYYADLEARRLMNEKEELRKGIINALGEEVYSGGELDRKVMGRKVFGDPGLLDKVNKLVHPHVGEDFLKWSEGWNNVPYVVEEAAILFESGAWRRVDLSVLIYAPVAMRLKRIAERDGISQEEIELRMKRQMDEEEKKRLADRVIYNDEKSLLLPRIIALHEEIKNRI